MKVWIWQNPHWDVFFNLEGQMSMTSGQRPLSLIGPISRLGSYFTWTIGGNPRHGRWYSTTAKFIRRPDRRHLWCSIKRVCLKRPVAVKYIAPQEQEINTFVQQGFNLSLEEAIDIILNKDSKTVWTVCFHKTWLTKGWKDVKLYFTLNQKTFLHIIPTYISCTLSRPKIQLIDFHLDIV